jgi:uncharacterized protein (TIRG00374 family)
MRRRWLLPILFVLFAVVAILRRGELAGARHALLTADAGWVLVALLLQAGYYVGWASLYAGSFRLAGVPARLSETLPLLLSALFVNVVVPTGGLSGSALFIDAAGLRGHSRSRAAAGVVVTHVADLSVVTVFLIAACLDLALLRALNVFEIVGTIAFAGIPIGLALLLFASAMYPDGLRGALSQADRAVVALAARIGRASPLPSDWVERTAADLAIAAEGIVRRPAALFRLFLNSVVMHTMSAASLGVLFLAFHQRVEPDQVLAGYAFGILTWVLSPVPQGIGMVEGVIALVYASLGVPSAVAALIALAFRALDLWLPMGIGFLLLRRLRSLRPNQAMVVVTRTVDVPVVDPGDANG